MSTPALASLLSLPRFRSVSHCFVAMARAAGIDDESALAHGVNAVRSELGRVFPGGELRRVGSVNSKGTLGASTKGESHKALSDSPALWVARVSLAIEALKNDGIRVDFVIDTDSVIRLRLLCGLK